MAAIITDQIRILNAKNFVSGVTSSANAYYSFIGLPNPNDYQSDWDTTPPSPKDNFTEENDYWDTMVALKKINSSDVRQVIPKRNWASGTTYDMYRHDYSRSKTAAVSGATNLYASFHYVMNTEYQVYICLQNGSNPDNPAGRPSLDEPTFTDLEPRSAGSSNDGYVWKYMYTITPSDVIKFETTDFMSVPADWSTATGTAAVRDNAVDGSIKIVTVTDRGVGLGTANRTYTRVPIKGDGSDAECTVVINNDSKVDTVTVSNQGTGNQIARVGVVENPEVSTGTLLSVDKAAAVNGLRLTGTGYSSATFTADAYVTQTIATGSTAVGRVINYNQTTGVLKYWQDRSVSGFATVGTAETNPKYGFNLNQFTATPGSGGSKVIVPSTGSNLEIDSAFTGISTIINNKTYYLGQSFTAGIAGPEVKKHAGNIIYVDNRPAITRSANQKEDIKVILQF